MHKLFIASSKVLRQVVVFLVITTQPALVSNAQEIPSSSKSARVLNLVELCPKREPIARKQVRVLTRSSEEYAEENQTQGNSFPGKENSGIVKSRTTDNLFWIHNDSGDEPKIYPIRANGEDYKVTRYAGDLGVTIAGAMHHLQTETWSFSYIVSTITLVPNSSRQRIAPRITCSPAFDITTAKSAPALPHHLDKG